MGNIYAGMTVAFGFILFCILLSIVWFFFTNLKKSMFSQKKSIEVIQFTDYQVEGKRIKERARIVWPVSVETNKGIIKAETKDLSGSGAFIKCSQPLLPGEQFVLNIEIPSKGPVSLKSEVVWSNGNLPMEKVVIRGMGIRFMQNMNEDLTLLKSSLDEYIESIYQTPLQRIAFI